MTNKADSFVIHDGRGNSISLEKPRNGGSVTVEFNGPVVCLKSVDHYGTVQEQKCIPMPVPQPAPAYGNSGRGGNGGCGCP